MPVNNPHSVDRAYKFIYRLLGIIFHWYLYMEGEEIEFIIRNGRKRIYHPQYRDR